MAWAKSVVSSSVKDSSIDGSYLDDGVEQGQAVPNHSPLAVKELDFSGGDEFLQCPSSSKPFTFGKSLRLASRNIKQVRITYLGIMVPAEHGIDSLGEFSATAFVYTASVDPDVLETSSLACKQALLTLSAPFF